jgi:hypothetical protein
MTPRLVMRRAVAGLGTLALSACAAVTPPEDEDAIAPSAPPPATMPAPAVPGSTLSTEPGSAPATAAPTAPPTEPGAPCRAALCVRCDAQGQPIMPEDEAACPSVDCSAFDTFGMRVVDDFTLCERQVHLFSGSRCAGLGVCQAQATPDVCGDVRPLEVLRTTTACQSVTGCVAGAMPALARAPQGTPCGDGGRCTEAGACDERLADTCPEYADAALCGTGLDPARGRYCAVAATGTCAATCTSFRRACIAAYEASPADACVAGAQVGCLEQRPALVCACTQSNL